MPPLVALACCPFAARDDSPELAQYSFSTPRWGLLKLGTFFGTAKDITPALAGCITPCRSAMGTDGAD